MSVTLTLMGVVWVAWFAWLDARFFVDRLVHVGPSWRGEHTLVVVAGVVGLVGPWLLRRRSGAGETLVDGRLEGGRELLAAATPVVCAAIMLLAMTWAMVEPRRCYYPPPQVRWNSWWMLYWAGPAAAAALVAALGLRRGAVC